MSDIKRKVYKAVNTYADSLYSLGISAQLSVLSHFTTQSRVRKMPDKFEGSISDYFNTVTKFWAKYHQYPAKYWYTLFCSGLEKYDPRFIPDYIWYDKILGKLNKLELRNAYVDKNMLSVFFPGAKQPETVIKNMNGMFYNGSGEYITEDEAAELVLSEQTELVFKPSVDSGWGNRVGFYDTSKYNAESLKQLFAEYKKDYIVQRKLTQHPDLAKINENSINTIRVISLFLDGEVNILSAILRMGQNNAQVDNTSAGGIACPIHDDGRLYDEAVTRNDEWTEYHSSGIKFSDIVVPSYDKIVETAKSLHRTMPYFGIIGWDFAVDAGGDVVLVEYNLLPGQNQIGTKEPTFGDKTVEILDKIFKK